jgi:hypothetical protein
MKREPIPRYRRLDLINSLGSGQQKYIARVCGCTDSQVSAVLNGRRSQTNDLGINIIRLAERLSDEARLREMRKDRFRYMDKIISRR